MSQRNPRAEYRKQYDALIDKHHYTEKEMLVVLKAYQRYENDRADNKSDDECGRLPTGYDISVAVFHDADPIVVKTKDLAIREPSFWDAPDAFDHVRLSEIGRQFVKGHPDLWDAAQDLLGGVTRFRRG